MKSFKDKSILITGAGNGLGRELALQLHGEGASLILLDRDQEALDRLKLIMPKAVFWNFDLCDHRAFQKKLSEIESLDVLVNNAGVVFGGSFESSKLEQLELTYQVNILSLAKIIHESLRLLRKSPEAHIINIASASALISFPNAAVYGSSKWAVLGLSETLHDEFRDQGLRNIDITVACPSYIQTELFKGARPPRLTNVLEPRELAEQILNAARRRKLHVRSPWIVKIIPLLKAVFPYPIFRQILRVFGVHSGMKTWRGRT